MTPTSHTRARKIWWAGGTGRAGRMRRMSKVRRAEEGGEREGGGAGAPRQQAHLGSRPPLSPQQPNPARAHRGQRDELAALRGGAGDLDEHELARHVRHKRQLLHLRAWGSIGGVGGSRGEERRTGTWVEATAGAMDAVRCAASRWAHDSVPACSWVAWCVACIGRHDGTIAMTSADADRTSRTALRSRRAWTREHPQRHGQALPKCPNMQTGCKPCGAGATATSPIRPTS